MKNIVPGQVYRERRWVLVKASSKDRLLYFLTFGLAGRKEWLKLEERDVAIFVPSMMDNRLSSRARLSGIGIDNYRPFMSNLPPNVARHLNCRCKITKL